MVKRAIDSPKRGRGKKSRTVNLVPVVVDVLGSAEALPTDLRTVFEVALPTVFGVDKADRHAYETEIVEQAEKSLAAVQAAVEEKHRAALAKQNAVTAPAEHAKRTAAKKEAEQGLEAAKAQLESKREDYAASKKAVQDANGVIKSAQKDAARAEKEMQAQVEKKTELSEVLVNEFVLLQEGTSNSPEGKQAVKKLGHIGKENHVDETLMSTLPLTCKKEPDQRSEFEVMMFTSLKAAIDRQIDGLTQKVAELEPHKAQKVALVAAAQDDVKRAEEAKAAAKQARQNAEEANKAAEKEVTKADRYLYEIWGDMKEACDAQDESLKELNNFKDNVWTAFHQLKEKEPEPEEPEAEEAVEETVEDATAEGEAGEAAP